MNKKQTDIYECFKAPFIHVAVTWFGYCMW